MQNASKSAKNNSQGIIFVIFSCQRVISSVSRNVGRYGNNGGPMTVPVSASWASWHHGFEEQASAEGGFHFPFFRGTPLLGGPFSPFSGKKKASTALLQLATMFPEKLGATEEDIGGRYGSPGFNRVFVSTTGLESFSLRPEKFSKRFSFGGGRVRFLLLCSFQKILVRNRKTPFLRNPVFRVWCLP